MKESFPQQARLHHGREFGRVFYRQQKAASAHTVLLCAPRPKRAAKRARLGIMVSAKVHKHAVRRHQLKRWVREWFRRGVAQRIGPMDLVVLFRRDPKDHDKLASELTALLDQALTAEAKPGSRQRKRRRGN